MSTQTSASNAINWPLLDDQPPAYTTYAPPDEIMPAEPSHLLDLELARSTLNDYIANMSSEDTTLPREPPDVEELPPRQPDFHADDYVADDNYIPACLLAHDTWLPDPPCEPSKTRAVDFQTLHPNGNAVLTYEDSDGSLGKVENLDLDIIKKKSPLIAAAFEASEHGQHSLHLDALTPLSAKPFARYLYLGSYAEVNEEFEEIPSSLLLHSQLHYLGALFDMTELKNQALVNVIRQCEFACFSHEQPIDLCAALRFCYDHHAYSQKPIDNIIAYCITRFTAHKLGEDIAFKLLAFEHKHFRSDLARVLVERDFADETAIDLIRLPFALADADDYPFVDAEFDPRAKAPVGRGGSHFPKRALTLNTKTTTPTALHEPSTSDLPLRTRPRRLTFSLREKCRAEGSADSDREESDDGSPRKRRKSEDDDFVLVTRPAVPSLEPPPERVDEAFVLLPDSAGNMSSPSIVAAPDSPNVPSLDSVDAPAATESAEVQASSPRSDSSWVIT